MPKILVAEDDPVTRTLISRSIESLGHVAIQASDGEVALSILKDNPDICLVITDMMMPKLNGKEMILTMYGRSEFKDIPVIIVSGVVNLSEIVEIMELGAYRFLPKPINVGDLKQYISTLLEPAAENGSSHL